MDVDAIVNAANTELRMGGGQGEKELLENCYRNSLKLAAEHGLHSVAFSVISSGIYGYPQEEAVRIATETIEEFLRGDASDMEVYLVVFGCA
jgi:O-acetyl-ADP-ribose deacetylase (regulator of RNase III)